MLHSKCLIAILQFVGLMVENRKYKPENLKYEWNGMEKFYLNRVHGPFSTKAWSIGALYLDISYLQKLQGMTYIIQKYCRKQFRHFQVPHQ